MKNLNVIIILIDGGRLDYVLKSDFYKPILILEHPCVGLVIEGICYLFLSSYFP